jgi:hypothetical protein
MVHLFLQELKNYNYYAPFSLQLQNCYLYNRVFLKNVYKILHLVFKYLS